MGRERAKRLESDYIVGQIIFADGGWNTGIMPDALDYIRENNREEEL